VKTYSAIPRLYKIKGKNEIGIKNPAKRFVIYIIWYRIKDEDKWLFSTLFKVGLSNINDIKIIK
jgi:hypothetical protein